MQDATKRCPACGEPVKESWKVCPACETPLSDFHCPQCKMPVKAHWKRCPECETPLLCSTCGRRIPMDHRDCPTCNTGPTEPKERLEGFREEETGIDFIHAPGGIFMMGDTFGVGIENETPVHDVRLDGFWIGRSQVTQAQWGRLMAVNPSKFKGEMHPVEQVSWEDVQTFIRKLNKTSRGTGRFDLPTEAQWEFAARSEGKEERYAGGDQVDDLAWYEENSGGMTHPVGLKQANGLGLYDMSGNVWEWCKDTYHPDAYHHHDPTNPVCLKDGRDRVIRGGSWNLDAWSVRCARRSSLGSDLFASGLGFRLVRYPE